jgi:hypothetical protein
MDPILRQPHFFSQSLRQTRDPALMAGCVRVSGFDHGSQGGYCVVKHLSPSFQSGSQRFLRSIARGDLHNEEFIGSQ